MPIHCRLSRSTPGLTRACALLLVSALLALSGCASGFPDVPSEPIDQLPFRLVVPLTGDQTTQVDGGHVTAVRWTVQQCPTSSLGQNDRHVVIGTRGATTLKSLPPNAVAVLLVCDQQGGRSSIVKTNINQGLGVDPYRYQPMNVPFLVLDDNTLEILAFEPGTLRLIAQPESDTGPVGAPHRFEVTIASGDDYRRRLANALATLREKDQSSSSGLNFAPSVLHSSY